LAAKSLLVAEPQKIRLPHLGHRPDVTNSPTGRSTAAGRPGPRALASTLDRCGYSFRSDLVAAARRGEGFDRVRGLPISKLRSQSDMPFFAFACKYVDVK
jgi:hypothetical protein